MVLSFIRLKILIKILKNLICNFNYAKTVCFISGFVSLFLIKLRTCFINLYDLCKLVILPNNNFNNHTYSKKGVNTYEEI